MTLTAAPQASLDSAPWSDTHPWITFNLDLKRFGHDIWLLLGEIESKCRHIAGAPTSPEVARELHLLYLSKGLHGTTSIEGNTLSEREVKDRITGDLDLPASREYQGREIDNILAICRELASELERGEAAPLTTERIKSFNRRILDGLPLQEGVVPGEMRNHSVLVGIDSYRGVPAEQCEDLLERMVGWLNMLQAPDERPELRFPLAVLKAIMAHLYIAWIHPFGDGNGRTARLIEFQLMIGAGAPSPAAHLLSNHYNLTRDPYMVELNKTSRLQGYPIEGFIHYALRGLVDQLREQIALIQEHQHNVMWEKFVHDSYRNEETPAKRRQRHLILDMPAYTPISRKSLRDVSVRVAREYAAAGDKTITRDINELVKRRLLIRQPKNHYMANRGVVAAFLPAALPDADM